MTATIENKKRIYQQLTHGQIAFMSELFQHFKAQKESDFYYLYDNEYFGDTEDKVKLPSIENSEVRSIFDDTWEDLTNGSFWLPLNLENFCNFFVSFRTFDTKGIDYSLLPYIDYVYKSNRSNKEWSNLISYGKKIVECTFNWDGPLEDFTRCTMTVLDRETDLTDADWKKHDAIINDYIAENK